MNNGEKHRVESKRCIVVVRIRQEKIGKVEKIVEVEELKMPLNFNLQRRKDVLSH